MRLLNSICKVMNDAYPNIPVHRTAVPADIVRPCFNISLITESYTIQNRNLYLKSPTYQIVYYGSKSDNSLEGVNELYERKEELTSLIFLPLSMPVIPKEGVTEKQRHAKISSFINEVRLAERAVYTKLSLDFEDEIVRTDPYELIQEVTLDTRVNSVK